MNLEPLDRIMTVSNGIEHHGVYLGIRWINYHQVPCVIHNTKGKLVEVVPLRTFANGLDVQVVSRIYNQMQRQQALKRAEQIIGMQYDLVLFNCEHASSYIQIGRPESPQLRSAVAMGIMIGVGILLVRSATK